MTENDMSEPWTPDPDSNGTPADVSSAIFQALGAASVCWEKIEDAGIFDSTRAEWIGEGLLSYLQVPGTR